MEIKDLKPSLIWECFDEITKVPRPSCHEDKIRAYLLDFAEKHGIESKTDKVGNVVLKKPATKGYENAPAVVLQAHMDMVAEKNGDVEHDFLKDPICAYVDGDWVKAKGTTLGADNGIGVAAALAVMADNSLEHGPVEALFTMNEEMGLEGAQNLGEGMIDGKILINLDSEDDGEIFIGCAGGIDTTAVFTYNRSFAPENFSYFKISVSGLLGGHSGGDIHLGRANANKVVARFIWDCSQKWDIEVSTIKGGNLRNAIPREAEAVFGVNSVHAGEISKYMERYSNDIKG
ncbi:MAG: beta-Ala-His dipeptidase, partial [Muribaculaceae bacterium]|nr:beta-Ala-His dipeptidase [Muribaculaceae bacterium]